MSKRLIGAAVAAAAVLISLVPAGSAATTGRTAVVGIDVDPPCLNVLLDSCNVAWSHWIAGTTLAGAFRVQPDLSYEPVLVDRVDVQAQPFALTYHIEPDAVWSDGAAVTADDFLFTLDAIRDPANATSFLRAEYDRITGAERVDAKTFTLRFAQPYAHWRSLFAFVLPKHVLAGHDLDQVWSERIAHPVTGEPIGSGPFLLTGRTRGQSLTVTPNPRWWGPRGPFLDSIVFRVVPNSNDQFQGIRDASLDLIFPQPQFGIADIGRVDGVVVESAPGTAMEHLDFNVQSAAMPLLREAWFRQAVAYSIDRATVAANAFEFLIPGYPALHNLSYSPAQAAYEPTFARYGYDPQAVAALMQGHGCFMGADGIWSCQGTRASVRVATTRGNALRERAQQLMIDQARAAGIELVSDNDFASVLFGTRLPAMQYELIVFAWVRGPNDSPRLLYGCGVPQNDLGYCSPAVDELFLQAEAEQDPAARAQLVNQAYRIMADDMATIPMFLRPAFLVRRDVLRGPAVNPAGRPTWNVEAWRLGSDETPPVTTASAAPAANANGWNNGPVTVELAATDDDTGVQEHRYTLTGAQTSGHWVAGDSSSVTVSAEGITRIEYFATDASGNVETVKSLTIRIDTTPPVVVAARSPAANERGWNNEDVTARFDATDALSGIDGETTASVVLAGEGADQSVERNFVDRAGNRASATVAGINIDKTAPTITCVAVPNLIWPPNNRLVPVQVAVGVTDGLSGSGGFVLARVGSDEPGSGDIQGFVVGTPDTSGLVRAERSPRGDGRVYTLDYEGADRAGNTAACVARVEVPLRRP